MKDALYISPYEPFETAIYLPPNPGPNNSMILAITGFKWWKLASLNATWANPAGPTALAAVVSISQSNNFLGATPTAALIAGAASGGVAFSIGAASSTGSFQFFGQTLPEIYVVGDGSVIASHDGGNAGKTISSIVVLVYGVRFRGKP